MSDRPILTTPVLVITLTLGLAIFAISVVLALNAPSELPRAGSDTRSTSALGHAGLYALLQRAGVPVARSQANGVVTTNGGDVLVLAEPPETLSGDAVIRLGRAASSLLVLPKRTGEADEDNPAWVKSTAPIGIDSVAAIARLLGPKIDVVRTDPPASWTVNTLGIAPVVAGTMQMIEDDDLTPILANGKDMLIAEYRDGERRTWILADPDVIENFGLGQGQNAGAALALLNGLRDDDGTVIFDETIHGMVNPVSNPFRKLVEFPLGIGSALSLVALGLLCWRAVGRFGKPVATPPVFDFGKRRLIATSAALLDRAGHQIIVMRRYVELNLHDVGRRFSAPPGLSDTELAAWLDAVGKSRGVELEASGIVQRVAENSGTSGRVALNLFAAAGDIHRWKDRISDGTSGRRSDR